MSKIVARMAKMKTGNLTGIGNHNQRKTENHSNKDIDISRSHLNYDLVNRTENYKTDIENFIDENKSTKRAVRKDAVLVNEWIITSDQNFFKDLSPEKTKEFFETAKDYFAENFGDENIRYATVHLDETTPHMHLGIVPFDKENKLSAKRVFDRKTLIKIQDELPKYLEERNFDLTRGEKGSEREHLTVPEYKEVQKKIQERKKELSELVKKQPVSVKRENLEVKELSKSVEVKTGETNFFGQEKTKTVKKKTGKVMLPKEKLEQLIKITEQYATTNKDLIRYVETDLVKENKNLHKKINKSYEERNELVDDYNDLVHRFNDKVDEVENLENKVEKLTREIKGIYQGVKNFFSNRMDDVKQLKAALNLVTKEILKNVPKGEFERLNKQEQSKDSLDLTVDKLRAEHERRQGNTPTRKNISRDRGMSR